MKFTIKKGKHSANGIHIGLITKTTLENFIVRFDKNCWYKPFDEENDWNKLFGWSLGILPKFVKYQVGMPIWNSWYNKLLRKYFGIHFLSAHHYNSIRTVWRPNPEVHNVIEVGLYVYEKGFLRYSEKGVDVIPDLDLDMWLYHDDGQVILDIEEIHNVLTLMQEAKPSFGYLLHPTFGGNYAAPHDITLNLITK